MAEWSRDKVEPQDINGGKEFDPDLDNLTVAEMNAIVNNSFYGVDFVEGMTEQPIVDNSNPNGEMEIKLVPYMKNGKTYYKFKFINAKGESGVATQPLGTLMQSTKVQTDAGLHLADGSELAINGIYSQFCQDVINNPNDYSTCTLSEWNTEYDTYGQCGRFAITDTYVKLPKITKMLESANSQSELGQAVKAGLPNITGEVTLHGGEQASFLYGVYGAFRGTGGNPNEYRTPLNLQTGSGAGSYGNFNIDASRSSSVYGNSDTVQVDTVKVYYYIVVGTVTKTDIEVNIDNIAGDLQLKSDKDAGNLSDENIMSWNTKLSSQRTRKMIRVGYLEGGSTTLTQTITSVTTNSGTIIDWTSHGGAISVNGSIYTELQGGGNYYYSLNIFNGNVLVRDISLGISNVNGFFNFSVVSDPLPKGEYGIVIAGHTNLANAIAGANVINTTITFLEV